MNVSKNPPPTGSGEFSSPGTAFLNECVRVPIVNLLPMKASRPSVKSSLKYLQILASVREVGLVEPPAVMPVPKQAGFYFLLDGHLRVEALKDLGVPHVDCLVATEDDTYSYNKRLNRLSAVQDHKMIFQAIGLGASAERLGRSLGISPKTIQHRFRLLNGICDEAVELLVDTACPAKVFDILRQMKPIRQMEAAELMTGNKNFSVMFANALLANTLPHQLVTESKVAGGELVSAETIARVERELASLQMQIKGIDESFGLDVLHLTIVKGYLVKLLSNANVVKWLATHQPEYLMEFQSITEMTELPSSP